MTTASRPAAAAPWLDALGHETIVCTSPAAPEPVRRAAGRVAEALGHAGGDASLHDSDAAILDYATLGGHHIIVVGRWEDDVLLRATWGFWATTRPQRDWQTRGDEAARRIVGLWERNVPPLEWRHGHDLYAFGYGDFDGADVGYVQTVRNPYTLLERLAPDRPRPEKPTLRVLSQPPDDQMRFAIHLAGVDTGGVVRAVDAFLDHGLLDGVLPGDRPPALDDWTLEGLGPRQLATDVPAWAPMDANRMPDGVRYLGQQMVGSHLYGGFQQASNRHPLRCWRLKYRAPSGFVLYDSYPTNRASGNELFIAELASTDEAAAAARALKKEYPGHVGTRGAFVVMHSFAGPAGAALLDAAIGREDAK